MGGKLDFGSRLERFMLFDEFDCLHLLPESSFALRKPGHKLNFESRKREMGSGRIPTRPPWPMTSYR